MFNFITRKQEIVADKLSVQLVTQTLFLDLFTPARLVSKSRGLESVMLSQICCKTLNCTPARGQRRN